MLVFSSSSNASLKRSHVAHTSSLGDAIFMCGTHDRQILLKVECFTTLAGGAILHNYLNKLYAPQSWWCGSAVRPVPPCRGHVALLAEEFQLPDYSWK